MGVTAHGIEYPDPADAPSRQALENLAESVDTAIGESGTVIGSGLPAGANPILGCWSIVCEVHDGGTEVGIGVCQFPAPFPNGICSVVAVNGDHNSGSFWVNIRQDQPPTVNGFGFLAQNAAGNLSGYSAVRLNVVAVGW
jgi:hypothetical protein